MQFYQLAKGARFEFRGKQFEKIAMSMAEDAEQYGNVFQAETEVRPIGEPHLLPAMGQGVHEADLFGGRVMLGSFDDSGRIDPKSTDAEQSVHRGISLLIFDKADHLIGDARPAGNRG
jgi:hypothetical protein